MKPPAAPPTTGVVLNANQTKHLVRNADVANEHGGLSLVDGGYLPDSGLQTLGLYAGAASTGPANRPGISWPLDGHGCLGHKIRHTFCQTLSRIFPRCSDLIWCAPERTPRLTYTIDEL